MKNASKNLLFSVLISFVSCREPVKNKMTTEKSFPSVFDYELDSLFYRIDAKGDFEKEVFLMTKNIIVIDSTYGI